MQCRDELIPKRHPWGCPHGKKRVPVPDNCRSTVRARQRTGCRGR